MRIAIVIPAYNEEITIEKTIVDFHDSCLGAKLFVVDNNSSDNTAKIVKKVFSRWPGEGHVLIHETRQGKSYAIRTAFMQIEADAYVMVDADNTYSGKELPELLEIFTSNHADMVVGDRHSNGDYGEKNTRLMHGFGNNLVRNLINFLFRAKLRDILSGYRIFSRRYVKSFPILSNGFELETEMTMHALNNRLLLLEHPVSYKERPANSFSKLNTYGDGFRVLLKIFNILRYVRPLLFFGTISLFFLLSGIAVGTIPVLEFIETRKILHFPSAILAVGLILCGVLAFALAVILDMLADINRKNNELHLLNLSNNSRGSD
jgi:glycosyltransferase involved in cell wall biosynthesis